MKTKSLAATKPRKRETETPDYKFVSQFQEVNGLCTPKKDWLFSRYLHCHQHKGSQVEVLIKFRKVKHVVDQFCMISLSLFYSSFSIPCLRCQIYMNDTNYLSIIHYILQQGTFSLTLKVYDSFLIHLSADGHLG